MINKKKVLVNSQITAMISILESETNLSFLIILWYFKGTTYFSLLLPLTLHAVILPYAFLMNTSDNKNRIVEVGWKNVFKNLFTLSKGTRVNIDDEIQRNESAPKSANKAKNTKTQNQVATISNNLVSSKNSSNTAPENSILSETTSIIPSKSTTSPNFVNLNAKDLVKQSDSFKAKQRLISSMINSEHNEMKYMTYFRNMVLLEENEITENILIDIEFADEPTIKSKPSDQLKVKGKGKGKNSKVCRADDDCPDKAQHKGAMDDQLDTTIELKGQLKDRMLKRMVLLNHISSLSHEDTIFYHEAIDQLIELEETFLEEH